MVATHKGTQVNKMTKGKLAGAVFGESVEAAVGLLFSQNIVVTAVKVKYPGIDPLLIVTAKTTEGPKIAFVGGSSLDQVGKVFVGMVRTESVEWKENKFELERLARMAKD
jgi:hypothetical protein